MLLSCLAVACIHAGCFVSAWPRRHFSAERWASTHPSERYSLAHSLLASETLLQRTRPEVIALLGPPQAECPGVVLSYTLRRPSWLDLASFAGDSLLLTLDSTGRVAEQRILRD
jgi:hypothetical protein